MWIEHQKNEHWNHTNLKPYPEIALHELFVRQAKRTPEHEAIIYGDKRLSYVELDVFSNRLAQILIKKGAGANVLVGICLERSIELIISILAVLKTGAAYVPVDPKYPTERIKYMMNDTKAPLLISQSSMEENLRDINTNIFYLDREISPIYDSNHNVEINLDIQIKPSDLSYIIYTSGTTGLPKGVALEHRSSVALISWVLQEYPRHYLKGVLASTSVCFDLSIFEIFVPLSCGGKVILADHILNLMELPALNEITLINTVPSAIMALLDLNYLPQSVKVVNLAGEPLRRSVVDKLYSIPTVEAVYNLYGPTEDTTYSTYSLISKNSNEEPTIGKPIANTSVLILNEDMEILPVGEVGEIYLAGDGLARGYLNNPGHTRKCFIYHPKTGARLYKTGDLGRYRVDGNIKYLGRKDHQVKIRGYRIELEEIESILSQHPLINQALVQVRKEEDDEDKRLVAYLVSKVDIDETKFYSEIDFFLKGKLPQYMIPNDYVLLKKMPLTPNGKVDRNRLPKPLNRSQSEKESIKGRNPVEHQLVIIYREILNRGQVNLYDHFFDIGGHSLLAMKLISRIQEKFQVSIKFSVLFENSSIDKLSKIIMNSYKSPNNPMEFVNRDNSHFPVSYSQRSLWILDRLHSSSTQYNIIKKIRIFNPLDSERLEQSFQKIMNRHESLRSFIRLNLFNEPTLAVNEQQLFNMDVIDLTKLKAADQERKINILTEKEVHHQFNLYCSPLFRATLIKLKDDENLLLINLHHIIADGWSVDILLNELLMAYDSKELPDLSYQFIDYVVWQMDHLKTSIVQKQIQYWSNRLQKAPFLTILPTDYIRKPTQSFKGALYHFEIPKTYKIKLLRYCKEQKATVFMVLLSVFMSMIYNYTAQRDILIGIPLANRKFSELENVIGFFINTLPLRIDFSNELKFIDILKKVQLAVFEAYQNSDVPFELIIENTELVRDKSFNPLFQMMFNYFYSPIKVGENLDYKIEMEKINHRYSKFDIDFYIEENEEGFEGHVEYNSDLFNVDSVEKFVSQYKRLLTEILVDSNRLITTYPLITEEEKLTYTLKNKVEVLHGKKFIEFKKEEIEQSIIDRLKHQIALYPSKAAIKTKDRMITYAMLNSLSNGIANRLIELGIKNKRVGLIFSHGIDMIVAMIGVLKTGSAYVPIESSIPDNRKMFILEDIELDTIITDKTNYNSIVSKGYNIINIDDCTNDYSDPKISIPSHSLAYIIYTSGSTGEPKGIMQCHRNTLQHIRNYTNSVKIDFDDRVLLLASYSFDASIMDIFGALLNGATLLPVDIKAESPDQILKWANNAQVTIFHSTPTIYRYLFQSNNKNQFETVRVVVLGGEEVQLVDIELYKKYFPRECYFVNGFGPSECTIALQYIINKEFNINNAIPIGYPVDGVEVSLINETGEKSEIYGEITLKSPYLAVGYWKRPELTKAVFLSDQNTNDHRVYKTGDLARLLPNGMLQYLGRKDNQVKIRGQRVDTYEIEAELLKLSNIREAVVVVRSENSKQILVAFLVGMNIPSIEIRRKLRQIFPEYMIPAKFIFVDSIPLTRSGKVDRRALPYVVEESENKQSNNPYNKIEEEIIEISKKMLGYMQIAMDDDFFEVGGDSLTALMLIWEINKKYNIEVNISEFIEYPILSELVRLVESQIEQE